MSGSTQRWPTHRSLRKRPLLLPFGHKLFRFGGIKPQASAAQRDAENVRDLAQPNERFHDRLDLDLEQLGVETRFQARGGAFASKRPLSMKPTSVQRSASSM